jgi:O-antigen/teichoic acid export membrane protein
MTVGWLWKYDHQQLFLLFVIGINQFLLSLVLYLRSNISALLHFKTDSFISVLDRLLMIVICSVLLWGNVTDSEFQISWFVYAQTAAYLLTVFIAMLLLFRHMEFHGLNWNRAFFIVTLKKSLPYALLILLMGLYGRIDTVLIAKLLPANGELQAGIYASAFRLLDVSNNMSGYLFAVLLLPLFAKQIAEKQDISQLVKLSFTLLFLFSSSLAIVSYFYGEPMMQLFYHQHISESFDAYNQRIVETAHLLRVLMGVFVFTSTTYVFGTLLTANGNLKRLNIIAFLGVIISLGVNYLLIPTYEAYGSAWASFTAQGITAILQVYLAFKLLNLHIERAYVAKLGLFVLLAALVSWLSTFLVGSWVLKISFLAFTIILIAFALRLLKIKAFFRILQKEKVEMR